jgi:hypothetical protein
MRVSVSRRLHLYPKKMAKQDTVMPGIVSRETYVPLCVLWFPGLVDYEEAPGIRPHSSHAW